MSLPEYENQYETENPHIKIRRKIMRGKPISANEQTSYAGSTYE